MQYQTITRENIKIMVDRFYSAVLKDDLIADFFIQRLGDEMISDEWQAHLRLLINFWATATISDDSYRGKPVKPHMHMEGLTRESFQRWLELFFQTVERLYAKEPATLFKNHGEMVANNFMRLLRL